MPFRKVLRGHVQTVPGKMLVKSEVHTLTRVGAMSCRVRTDRYTKVKKLYPPLFTHALGGGGYNNRLHKQ